MIKGYPKHKRIELKGKAKKALQEEVLLRDGMQCLISGEATQAPFHHIEYKSSQGGDTAENAATVAQKWHTEIHDGSLIKVLAEIQTFYGPKQMLKYFLLGVVSEREDKNEME